MTALGAEELDLLAKLIEADEAASERGFRDDPFSVFLLNGGATYLDHKGFGAQRPPTSRRAVVNLRAGGVLQVVSETKGLLRFYLAPNARERLVESQPERTSSSGSDESATQHLIEVVFEHFREYGEWPFVEALRHQLDLADDELDVVRVGRQLDPALGRIEVGYEGRVALTIHGVAACANSESELLDCLYTAQYAYSRYRSNGPNARVTSDDLARDLGMSPLRLTKTRELTQWLPGLNAGGGADEQSWHRLVTGDVTAFRKITTVREMLAIAPRPRGLNAMAPPGKPALGTTGSRIESSDSLAARADEQAPIASVRDNRPVRPSSQAIALARKLLALPEPLLGPAQPFSVNHRGGGVVRISHYSLTPSWLDESEGAFQELQAAGLFLPSPGGATESYFLATDAAARLSGMRRANGRRGREIAPEDVDEFRLIRSFREVDPAVVESLRRAHEKTQIEPALRRIVRAVDETAHGPKEVADIVAPLHVLGSRTQAGFVNKGTSLRKVTETAIAHQVVRVPRELPGVGLIVLAAVGDIQDDAKGMLAHVGRTNEIDWAILDRRVLARIFVAYGEICPNDGNWLSASPCTTCGYSHVEDLESPSPGAT